MANIPLKSIEFPDLADTYTVPSNAGELPYNKSATYPADTVGKALQNIGDSSAPAIIETAQGSIASFNDGADNIPVKDLVAEIAPLQSGSGDPSPDNVRPITGWTEAEIHVADGENPHIVDNVTTINWQSQAGTVYGGSIDVTSGVLTIDRAIKDLGDLGWSYNGKIGGVSRFSAGIPGMLATTSGFTAKLDCSSYLVNGSPVTGSGVDKTVCRYGADIYINDDSYSGASAFTTAVTGAKLVYPLATPTTVQLTPEQVNTLKGNNNVWANTGDVTVEYVADTKTFIENLVNA